MSLPVYAVQFSGSNILHYTDLGLFFFFFRINYITQNPQTIQCYGVKDLKMKKKEENYCTHTWLVRCNLITLLLTQRYVA